MVIDKPCLKLRACTTAAVGINRG